MKIDRVRQLESVTGFGQATSLIRDVLDNLELEQSLTWLLEAIQHAPGKRCGRRTVASVPDHAVRHVRGL